MKVYTLPIGPLQTNCYIVSTEKNNCIIIDPGYYGNEIVKKIEKLQLIPVMILITHGHYDHIGGIDYIEEKYPNIPIYIGKDEKLIVEYSRRSLKNQLNADIILDNALELSENDIVEIDDLSFKAMHTPGHSLGGMMYICKDRIFSGDTIFYEEIGRCDLYTGDFDVMLETLRGIYALEGDYIIYPGHGQTTRLSHEKKHNPYIKQAITQ